MSRFFLIAICLLSALSLAFLPIFQTLDVYADARKGKLAFSLRLFGFIKLLGGYFGIYKDGVVLHSSYKKVYLLPYREMDEKRKKFSFVKSFRLFSFRVAIESGAEYALYTAILDRLYACAKEIAPQKSILKKRMLLSLWLTDGDILRACGKITTYFNLTTILKSFFIFLSSRIKGGTTKKWKNANSAA